MILLQDKKVVDDKTYLSHSWRMDTIADLLRIVDAFAATRKVSDARASTLIFGDGTRIKHLRNGGDMGVRRIQRALFWLSDNWPNGADWPADIVRPEIHSSSPGVTAASAGADPSDREVA